MNLRRENVMMGRVIRHSGWSTDKVVRLIRRGTARYPNRRVHADISLDGPAPVLSHPMRHVSSGVRDLPVTVATLLLGSA